MPPTRAKRSMPLSSTWVIMRPTSSMCAASMQAQSTMRPCRRFSATRLPTRRRGRCRPSRGSPRRGSRGPRPRAPRRRTPRESFLSRALTRHPPFRRAAPAPAAGGGRRGERVRGDERAGEGVVEPDDELREQPCRALDVAQRHGLHGGVHGAHGDAEQAAWGCPTARPGSPRRRCRLAPGTGSTWYGSSTAFAAATSRSNMRGWMFGPSAMARARRPSWHVSGPETPGCCPKVTSMATAAVGSMPEGADARALQPVSSCTVATAYTSHACSALGTAPRGTGRMAATAARSSMALHAAYPPFRRACAHAG